MISKLNVTLVTFFATALSACADTAGGPVQREALQIGPSVRDSAGVTIYQHSPEVFARAPLVLIDSLPIATFAGSVEDLANDVTPLYDFAFLSDGRIAAVDPTSPKVAVLNPSDGSRIDHGRSGGGPREFSQAISLIRAVGDTLLIQDHGNGRIAILTADAGVLKTFRMREPGRIVGRRPDGSFLSQTSTLPHDYIPKDRSVERAPLDLIHWHPDWESVDTISMMPGRPTSYHVNADGWGVGVVWFAVAPGYYAWGGAVLEAPAESWVLRRSGPAGKAEIRISVARTPTTVAMLETEIEALFSNRISQNDDTILARLRKQWLDEPMADFLPAYGGVHVTPDGTVWVTDHHLKSYLGWAATAFDSLGVVLGRIEVASGEPPVAFGDDRLLFRTRDEDGIATLSVHRLKMSQ